MASAGVWHERSESWARAEETVGGPAPDGAPGGRGPTLGRATGSVIVAGARTPMGRLMGSLKDVPATRLGGIAIAGALQRAGISPEQVEYVIMGQVLQAGCGQIPARQAAVEAGIPMTVPALTINKVCLSGLD